MSGILLDFRNGTYEAHLFGWLSLSGSESSGSSPGTCRRTPLAGDFRGSTVAA
ncbi:MAG: hypothetical protein R3C20_25240 [Planctomycetaceae bacterium]